jgi:ribosomal RNA-processing protein 9
MPDPFFTTSKPKRKRTDSTSNAIGPKKLARTSKDGRSSKKHQHTTAKSNGVSKKRLRDEDLSDQTDGEGVDDMDLRAEDVDPGASGDEDDTETPAGKRLRLAQVYLDSLKTSLGVSSPSQLERFSISNARLCSGWGV